MKWGRIVLLAALVGLIGIALTARLRPAGPDPAAPVGSAR